ncbi:hypothetical protein ACWD25_23120, partial [Streptomyces sp. NPDC002920]
MGTSPEEERHGEIEPRAQGRPPGGPELSATEAGRRLAELLHDVLGPTSDSLSPVRKIPTFTELDRLLRLARRETGRRLSRAQRQELDLAHLRALDAAGSHLPELFLTEQACQAYQAECERAWSAERQVKKELVRTQKLLHKADMLRATAVAQLARSQRERDDASARLAHARKQLIEVETELAEQKALLRGRIGTLHSAVNRVGRQRRHAEQSADTARLQLAGVQRKLLEEMAGREAVEEELALVAAALRQVRAERDAARAANEQRDSESAVLADADAAVRRAERRLSRALLPETSSDDGDVFGPGDDETDAVDDAVAGPENAGPEDAGAAAREHRLLETALFGTETAVADLLAELADEGDTDAVHQVLSAAAGRPGDQVAALIQALGDAGYRPPHLEQLFRHASEQPPTAVVELLRELERADATAEIGMLLDTAVLADARGLLSHLLSSEELRPYATRLLDAAVHPRSMSDVADLLVVLEREDRQPEADGLVRDAVTRRSPRYVLSLLRRFSGLRNEQRYVTVAMEAAARRRPTAVEFLARALTNAGPSDVAARLLGRAAQASVDTVAETAARLAAGPPAHRELEWLLTEFRSARPDQLEQLASHLGARSPAALGTLLAHLGRHAPADLLVLWAALAESRLPMATASPDGPPEDAVDVLFEYVARRPAGDVVEVVDRLFPHHPRLSHRLVGRAVRRPAERAAEILTGLADAGLDDDTLCPAAGDGAGSLTRFLDVAGAVHERRHRRLAASLAHHAGGRVSFTAADLASVLRSRRPGWLVQPLLTGAGTRFPALVAELAMELYRQGLGPYVQLMLSTVPARADTVVPLAHDFWSDELRQDACWLLSRWVATESVEQLANALCDSAQGVRDELMLQIVLQRPGQPYAAVVTALTARNHGHLGVALVACAAQATVASAVACAAALEAAGRAGQSRWVRARAGAPRSGNGCPPAGSPRELVQAVAHFHTTGMPGAAAEVLFATLEGGAAMPWYDVLRDLPDAAMEETLRLLVAHASRQVLAADGAQLVGVLTLLEHRPELRARFLQPPPEDAVGYLETL